MEKTHRPTSVILTLACALVACAAFAQDDTNEAAPDESRRISFPEQGFSIIPPESWTPAGKTKGLFMNYRDPQPAPFQINMNANVTVHDTTPAKEVALKTRGALAQLFKDYKLLDSGPVTIDGRNAHFIVGRFTAGKFNIQNIQFLIPTADGSHFYAVTFTALTSNFPDHKPLFLKTAQTIRLSPFQIPTVGGAVSPE